MAATSWSSPTRRRLTSPLLTSPPSFTRRRGGHAGEQDRIHAGARRRRSVPANSRSGTSRSNCPTNTWRREKTIQESVQVGTVTHKLNVANDKMEIYDFPGGYAKRLDGVDKGGGEQASNLQKIFDGQHAHRRHPYAAGGSAGPAGGRERRPCRHSPPATRSTLDRALLRQRQVRPRQRGARGDSRRSDDESREPVRVQQPVHLHPVCAAVPPSANHARRRPCRACRPAIVVGPAGEEIFTDKYGRVKVQFHWDREGKNDAQQLLLDARRHVLGGQAVGRDPHSPHRAGSHRRFHRGRCGPADHRRQRLQRRR